MFSNDRIAGGWCERVGCSSPTRSALRVGQSFGQEWRELMAQAWQVTAWQTMGSGALGVVIAWLLRTYIDRNDSFPLNALVGAASVMLGGVTLTFFKGFVGWGAPLPADFFAYPLGLLFGIIVYPLMGMWDQVVKDSTAAENTRQPGGGHRAPGDSDL